MPAEWVKDEEACDASAPVDHGRAEYRVHMGRERDIKGRQSAEMELNISLGAFLFPFSLSFFCRVVLNATSKEVRPMYTADVGGAAP